MLCWSFPLCGCAIKESSWCNVQQLHSCFLCLWCFKRSLVITTQFALTTLMQFCLKHLYMAQSYMSLIIQIIHVYLSHDELSAQSDMVPGQFHFVSKPFYGVVGLPGNAAASSLSLQCYSARKSVISIHALYCRWYGHSVMPVSCEKKSGKAAARPLWAQRVHRGRRHSGGQSVRGGFPPLSPKIFVNFTANSCDFLIPEGIFKHLTKLIWFGFIQVEVLTVQGSSCCFLPLE